MEEERQIICRVSEIDFVRFVNRFHAPMCQVRSWHVPRILHSAKKLQLTVVDVFVLDIYGWL